MTIQVKKCFWKTNLILIMRFKKSTHLHLQVTPNLSLWCKKQQLNRLSYKVLGGDSAILGVPTTWSIQRHAIQKREPIITRIS